MSESKSGRVSRRSFLGNVSSAVAAGTAVAAGGAGVARANTIAGVGRKPSSTAKAKNVIVLIVDGCSSEQYTLARWFKGKPLAIDDIRVGALKTHSSDSIIPDSAPATSAFATGYRTSNKVVSLAPRDTGVCKEGTPSTKPLWPLATVLEGARLQDKGTGVVATSRVTHATPAAYFSHVGSRKDENSIMEQAVHSGVDVVLGGGRRHLLPKAAGGKREDGKNLVPELKQRGYQLPQTAKELSQVRQGKVFGTFADSHLAASIDRKELAPEEPTLLEMTRKSIELLSGNPNGFFLFVEASQVDWACHANDPGFMLGELLMYDQVVRCVRDFAERDGETMVMAFSDHNCGGMSIGNYATDGTYWQTPTDALVEPLKSIKLSTEAMWDKLGDSPTADAVRKSVAQYWGVDLTDEEANEILQLADTYVEKYCYNALGKYLSERFTAVGWSTHGHVGGDVPLHAFGPGHPEGLLDGPDVGRTAAQVLGIDLEQLNRRLYRDLGKELPNARVAVQKSGGSGPVIRVEVEGRVAELPVNTNQLILGDRTIELDGLVILVEENGRQQVSVPAQVIEAIRGIRVTATS